MKKTFIIALLLLFGSVAQTQATSSNSNQGAKAGQTNTTAQGQAGNATQTQEQNQVKNQGEETQIQTQEQNKIQTKDKSKDETKNSKGQVNAESHRSTVATFVKSLLDVSDREGGIGQQVKVIAQQQNDSKEKVADEIASVESRGKIKTFFFGSDYKNLGDLRSDMVKTGNQIEQLKRLAEKAENEDDKIELQNQIQVLEQEQANIESFITQNESKFSLFGWAVKLFQ